MISGKRIPAIRFEISEKQGSSLLNNIFSTMLNLALLQIRNSPPLAVQTAEFAAVSLDKHCCRKNLQFALRTLFSTFSERLLSYLDINCLLFLKNGLFR
jgi:hypothetical protein